VDAATCKKELVIEIPADVVRQETESVTDQYRKLARIPGFRKGHAPASLVHTRFRKDIQSEVVQSLLPKFFETVLKDQKLSLVGRPRFEDLKIEENQPLTAKASFEVYPDFELKEYKGLEIFVDQAEVKDGDVDQTLEKLRERAATYEVVEDRPAADDDFLTVGYQGHDTKDRKSQPVEAREAVVHLGAEGTVAGFTENLRGTKAGDTREFEVAYPADYAQKALAGKTYAYHVEVQAVKKKVIPALDDDLAKTVSEFQTLEELREKIRKDLQENREERARNQAKQKLLEELVKLHDFPVPEALVEERLEQRLESTLTRLMAQGIDPRTIDVDWHKVREESRPEAEKEVRGDMILEQIGTAEKIEVTDEEVDDFIREMAEQRHEAPAALKTRLTQQGVLDKIKSSRRNQKALELVYQSAKINRKSEQLQT
jgi:trigger factor